MTSFSVELEKTQENLSALVIGKSEADAEAICKAHSYDFRVLSREGEEPGCMTCDYCSGRLNVHLSADGQVLSCNFG